MLGHTPCGPQPTVRSRPGGVLPVPRLISGQVPGLQAAVSWELQGTETAVSVAPLCDILERSQGTGVMRSVLARAWRAGVGRLTAKGQHEAVWVQALTPGLWAGGRRTMRLYQPTKRTRATSTPGSHSP